MNLNKWDISIPTEIGEYSTIKEQTNFLNKFGRKASITDFAILLGGSVSENSYTNESNDLIDRCGMYWTKEHNNSQMSVVNERGIMIYVDTNMQSCGVRILIEYNQISFDKMLWHRDKYNIYQSKQPKELEYGYYPQTAPNIEMQHVLNNAYKNKMLFKTDVVFEVPESFENYEIEKKQNFNCMVKTDLNIYEYDEKLYIRVPVHFNVLLSNGVEYCNEDYVWIEVEPIRWLVPDGAIRDNFIISKKILFAGIPYAKDDINLRNYQYSVSDDLNKKRNKHIFLSPLEKELIFYEESSEINKFIKNHWESDILKVKYMKDSLSYKESKRKYLQELKRKIEILNEKEKNSDENSYFSIK